jgi:hypothetical protein
MSKSLKINGSTILPVHNIRAIRPITDEDRARMAAKYEKPVDEFAAKKISIEFADKSNKTADLSLDDVRAQGVALVNVGNERYVPAANIRSADPFSKEDAAKLKEGGDYTLTQTFRSRVDTTAGTVLSSATPQQIIDRAAKALEAGQGGKSTGVIKTAADAQAAVEAQIAKKGAAPKAPANG